MSTAELIILIAVTVIAGGAVSMLAVTIPIARREFTRMFRRESPLQWGRENSCPENEEHTVMFEAGLDWGRENAGFVKEVQIENEGLRLFGEYFDFGFDRCVIVLPGRAESLLYSYYFGEPYKHSGYNVLVIDQRAHGKSDGVQSGVGILEKSDVKAWMEYINREFGAEEFVIHGVCIGSSTAVFLAAENTPRLKAIVLEGPYISFTNVLIQRVKAENKPTFPIVQEMAVLFKKKAGINILKEKPLNYIRDVRMPVLFLCGSSDYSSLPKHSQTLFKKCGSENKKIVWFEKGAHSHLRISNTEEYDRAVEDFLKTLEK